jgi:hypothetical protein
MHTQKRTLIVSIRQSETSKYATCMANKHIGALSHNLNQADRQCHLKQNVR